MSGTWGRNLKLSIFGESHGLAIGMVVDGLPPNIPIDLEAVQFDLSRRAPGNDPTATKRKESDRIKVVSGLLNGVTTGAPICGMIENNNTRSADYQNIQTIARPSHADYAGFIRYQGGNDIRGGGHFSGRLTAPMVFAGALARQWLLTQNTNVGAHILSIGSVAEKNFDACHVDGIQLKKLQTMKFPLLQPEKEILMRDIVEDARMNEDSVGGVIECAASGIPAGLGSPFFDSVESLLAHLVFSVPATKGIEFGDGFDLTTMRGSQANDPIRVSPEQTVFTTTNHNGGINGGITNGMPIVFRVAIKPTASISQWQKSIDYRTMKNENLSVHGRHDPCIVIRAVPVIESCLLLTLAECLLEAKGNRGACRA